MNILKKISNRAFLILEEAFSKNWFNPFVTLYLNLRSLPFLKAIKMPIWIYGRPRIMALSGEIKIDSTIQSGMIKINYINNGPSNMSVQTEIANYGTIIFKGRANIRTGNRILVVKGGTLEIGNNFIMGDMINIGCTKSIIIGDNVRLAHRSQIFDSNYHYVANFNKMIVPPLVRPIIIGSNSWICNSCTIAAGAKIPNFTIVSTNSLVNKDFSSIEEGSIIGGIPAKPIASGYKLVNNRKKEAEISKFYVANQNCVYAIPKELDNSDWFDLN